MSLLRKLLPLAVVALAFFCAPPSVRASCGSIPYTFSNSVSIVDAATTNANNNFFLSCATTVDNTQIGAAGIFASQIIPTSVAQATFGGAFGYTIGPIGGSLVPWTIKAPAGQSADISDVFLNVTKVFWLDSAGVLHTNGAPIFGGVPTWTGALPIAQGGSNATSFTSSRCVRFDGTSLVSAASDCTTGGGSGVTSATAPITFGSGVIACATCAVTNANNNFSTAQTITGLLTATSANLTVGNAYAIGGSNIVFANAFNTKLYPSVSGGFIYIESFANVDNAHFPDAGGFVLDRGLITVSAATASTCAGFDGSKIVTSSTSCITSLTAGTNISITGGASTPTIATVVSPSFTNVTASGTISGVGITDTGTTTSLIAQSKANGATAGPIPPCYTAAGAACASSAHTVVTTANTATSCAAITFCTGSTVTLTGSAIFTSGTSYSCTAQGIAPTSTATMNFVVPASGSSFTLYEYNFDNSVGWLGGPRAVGVTCTGT